MILIFVGRQRQRQIYRFLSGQEKLIYQISTLGGGGGGGGKNWEVSQYVLFFPNQIPNGEVVNFCRPKLVKEICQALQQKH